MPNRNSALDILRELLELESEIIIITRKNEPVLLDSIHSSFSVSLTERHFHTHFILVQRIAKSTKQRHFICQTIAFVIFIQMMESNAWH